MQTTYKSPTFSRLQRIGRVFDRFWMVAGKPVVQIVEGEASWNLLGDITKDPMLYAFVYSHEKKGELQRLWCSKEIRIVPSGEDRIVREIEYAGVIPDGDLGFFAMANHRHLLENSFRVLMDNSQYVVENVEIIPNSNVKVVAVSLGYWSGDKYGCGGL